MGPCTRREELTTAAAESLKRIKSLIEEQIAVLRQPGGQARLLELDRELEKAVGEKERGFGALTEHTKEHGC